MPVTPAQAVLRLLKRTLRIQGNGARRKGTSPHLTGAAVLHALLRSLRLGLLGAALGAAIGLVLVPLTGMSSRWVAPLMLLGAVAFAAASRSKASPLSSHGSARFASPEEQEAMGGDEGLVIGRSAGPSGHLLRYRGPGHLVTFAPTRAGKGVGAVIPNLLLADRPALVIDPKGENYRVTAAQREKYGPIYRLDPFGVCGEAAATLNPLDSIRMERGNLVDDVATLTAAIVSDPPDQVREAHWNDEASALVSGLILYCLYNEPAGTRNLGRVREYLTLPPERYQQLTERMQESADADGLVARAANRRLGQNEREAASVLSTAQRHTHFLDSDRIVHSTASSGFRFCDIVERNGTAYLILPPDRMAAYARWLRIILSQAINELVSLGASERTRPFLFLLDECATLGRMTALESAFGLMAGYGMQVWCVFQDLHQMRAIYGTGAGTLLANAGIVQAFNVNDLETARWLSSTLGLRTESYSTGSGEAARTARPLLGPDEILNLSSDSMLLLRQTGRPLLARKVRYYQDAEFDGLFEAA